MNSETQNTSRFSSNTQYPPLAYIEMVGLFLMSNFVYHQNVYRRNNLKLNFLAFMIVNSFTSYNVCEMMNYNVNKYYASQMNNHMESQHRGELNKRLKKKLFGIAF